MSLPCCDRKRFQNRCHSSNIPLDIDINELEKFAPYPFRKTAPVLA